MANWFYYDDNGQKLGPINNMLLKALVAQGVILPETIVETEDGRKGRAGKIKGLTFPEMIPFSVPPFPSAQQEPVQVSASAAPADTSGTYSVADFVIADPPAAVASAVTPRAGAGVQNGTNWFYYGKNGQKLGPIDNALLKALVENRVVLPETILETESGQRGEARKVNGLFPQVAVSASQPIAVPMSEQSQKIVAIYGMIAVAVLVLVILVSVIFNTNSPANKSVPVNTYPAPPPVVNTPAATTAPYESPPVYQKPKLKVCDKCSGRGTMFLRECRWCRGSGVEPYLGGRCTHCNGVKACGCLMCEGTFTSESNIQGKCSKCKGSGNLGYE
jgi:hypothetical protein